MASDNVVVRRAATVLMLRESAGGEAPTLYMMTRSSRSPFMPDAMVFPGGALDPEDGDPELDDSFLRAARRESQEEANIDLGGQTLSWFDSWQTPAAESRRRFLARFYLARLSTAEGMDAQPDGHEATSGQWASAETYLERWRRGEIDLPVPTLCVLLSVDAHGAHGLAGRANDDLRIPILPRIKLATGNVGPRGDGVMVVLPHDPEYPDLPGEPCPTPQRGRELPSRFLREGNRWNPC